MAKGKRYYWIKLKDSFMTSDKVDFLMSQKDGANYVVLYQMLCLKTINTNGSLSRQIGEMIIPFDVDKIQRDCKYFDRDTVIVALELFKRLGMIYESSSGNLQIAEFDNMVGSETDYAKQKRLQREQGLLISGQEVDKGVDNVHTENRDKRIEIRDKIIDKDTKKKTSVYEGLPTELITALKDFEDMRKKIKSPMTDKARTLLVNKLKDLASNGDEIDTQKAIRILDQSILNNWKSVYELKEKKSTESVF